MNKEQHKEQAMNHTSTNCREENGITVGLIDSIISIVRVLKERDLNDREVKQALLDLRTDPDFKLIFDSDNWLVVTLKSSTPELEYEFGCLRVNAKNEKDAISEAENYHKIHQPHRMPVKSRIAIKLI